MRMEHKETASELEKLGEDGIDKEIKKLEWEMHTRTMPLQEEKKYVQRITQLKKEKPKLEQKQRKLEELERQKDEAGVMKKPIQQQLDDLNEEIKKSKNAKEEKFGELNKLRGERDA